MKIITFRRLEAIQVNTRVYPDELGEKMVLIHL